jgi:hypothetical protein
VKQRIDQRHLIAFEPAVEYAWPATGNVSYRGSVAFGKGVGIGQKALPGAISEMFRLDPRSVSQ